MENTLFEKYTLSDTRNRYIVSRDYMLCIKYYSSANPILYNTIGRTFANKQKKKWKQII